MPGISREEWKMITYEILREFVTKEKNSQKLAELSEDFFKDARIYLESKARASEGKEDLWELDNSRRMLQDLLDARESKLVRLALMFVRAGVTPGKVMPEEKEFFDRLVDSIRGFQDVRKETIEGKKEKLSTVAIIKEVPRFVAVNTKEYGPFKEGDVASVPKDNAEMLVKNKMARVIEGK